MYNDRERLLRCLTSLGDQSYPAHLFEVIVVDNNSTHHVCDLASLFPNVKVIPESVQGPYAARNTGILAARGPIYAFTDSDCLPDRDWLTRAVERLIGERSVGIVAGAIRLSFLHDKPNLFEIYDQTFFGFRQRYYVEKLNFSATANMLTKREVFETVGLFQDALVSGGDFEWGQRVSSKGYHLELCENAVVYHPARACWLDIAEKEWRIGRQEIDLLRLSNAPLSSLVRCLFLSFCPKFTRTYKLLRACRIPAQQWLTLGYLSCVMQHLRFWSQCYSLIMIRFPPLPRRELHKVT